MDSAKEGGRIPAFSLQSSEGQEIKNDSFPGKWIVLYFYPKDNTSGCTLEAKDFSDLAGDFANRNAVVVGVSPDSIKSHCNFTEKHNLKIVLLSDPEHTFIEQCGVWVLKKMYGREYYGVERSTFIIDPDGIVRHIWRKVKVNEHAARVFETLQELQK